MSNSRIFVKLCLPITMMFIVACTGLTKSDKPAISKWWLEPYVAGQVEPNDPPVRVAVSINVVPGLDTDRILTLSDNAELGEYASARWADHVPELVGSLLARSLTATGQFVVVPESAASRHGNCLLELELREFFADIAASGSTTTVSIRSYGSYQCKPGAPLVIQSDVSVPVADERMSVIVAAFQEGMDQLTRELLYKIQ